MTKEYQDNALERLSWWKPLYDVTKWIHSKWQITSCMQVCVNSFMD